jgi:hypothetical protein
MCKHHLRVLSYNAVLAGTRGELGGRTDRYCELGLEPTERLMNVATLPPRTLLVPPPVGARTQIAHRLHLLRRGGGETKGV